MFTRTINLEALRQLADETSIAHVARLVGVERCTVYDWLAGRTVPQERHLQRLGELMDVTLTITAEPTQSR